MSDKSFNIKVHPGEILKEEFLLPFELSAGKLAKKLDVPRTRIERLIKEETAMTSNTALRLSKYFGTTPQFWLNLQTNYDLIVAKEQVDLSMIKPMVIA